MGFENLPNVHTRWNAEWVQNDIDRRAVLKEWHVFDRVDLGDNTLVSVTSGHFVAWLQLTLHSEEDFHNLHHARRQVIALLNLVDFVVEAGIQFADRFVELLTQSVDLGLSLFRLQRDFPKVAIRQLFQVSGRNLAGLEASRSSRSLFPGQNFAQTIIGVALKDGLLVFFILLQLFDLLTLNLQRALVFIDAVAVKHTHLNNRTRIARRHTHRGVTNVRRFLTKDRAEKLFFRRHWALALRRHLTDQNIASLHLGSNCNNAGFVEITERFFTNVWNVTGDFFWTKLGITRRDFKLFQVDRCVDVVAHDTLRDQDRVLEVVAVPRHKRDKHVAAERQFAEIG